MLTIDLHFVNRAIAHTSLLSSDHVLCDFLGSFCNCLLPESIQVAAVRHVPERLSFAGKIQTLKYLPICSQSCMFPFGLFLLAIQEKQYPI